MSGLGSWSCFLRALYSLEPMCSFCPRGSSSSFNNGRLGSSPGLADAAGGAWAACDGELLLGAVLRAALSGKGPHADRTRRYRIEVF